MLNFNVRLTIRLSILVFLYANGIIAEVFQNEFSKFSDLPEPRIINGTEAKMEASRHQVSIRKKKSDGFYFGSGHICGGSLISENVVLSAAHCFVNYDMKELNGSFHPDDQFIAVMGDLNRYEKNNNTLIFDFVKIVKKVDTFNLDTYQKDIVLLILNGKVPPKHPTVRPIILNDSPIKNNTICHATGWGKTERGIESDVLMTVDLPFINADDCRANTLYETLISDGMFCAGYLEGGKDSCTGDSGGPLVCEGVQAGILSWGSGCAKPMAPGVFTDVASYKNWILEEVANHNGTLPKFASDIPDYSVDGTTSLSCSLILINLMAVLNFVLKSNEIKFLVQ